MIINKPNELVSFNCLCYAPIQNGLGLKRSFKRLWISMYIMAAKTLYLQVIRELAVKFV